MKEYHKIQTVYKRNPEDMKKVLVGQYALPEFEFLANSPWMFTEKIDGTNVRIQFNGQKVTFRGKTDNAQLFSGLYRVLEESFPLALMKSIFPDCNEVCLYGEGYGAKIQSGGNYIPDGQDFILFDVKVGPWWLERANIEDIANKLDIKIVPIVGTGTLAEMTEYVRAKPKSTIGTAESEGVVARPSIELFTRRGERVITKLKARDF